jgi:hypothetical protein
MESNLLQTSGPIKMVSVDIYCLIRELVVASNMGLRLYYLISARAASLVSE